jgi:acyl CoA:acetate/3-ketoacid CoA transferase beta subunit
MFGVRGAPGNTINHATSYWVGNHSKRVFGESVDIVSGIGWDKVDPTTRHIGSSTSTAS